MSLILLILIVFIFVSIIFPSFFLFKLEGDFDLLVQAGVPIQEALEPSLRMVSEEVVNGLVDMVEFSPIEEAEEALDSLAAFIRNNPYVDPQVYEDARQHFLDRLE